MVASKVQVSLRKKRSIKLYFFHHFQKITKAFCLIVWVISDRLCLKTGIFKLVTPRTANTQLHSYYILNLAKQISKQHHLNCL